MVASFDLFKPVDADLDLFEDLDFSEAKLRYSQASLGPVKHTGRSSNPIKLGPPISSSEQSEALNQNQLLNNKELSSPFNFGRSPIDKKDGSFSPKLRAFDPALIQSTPSLQEAKSGLDINRDLASSSVEAAQSDIKTNVPKTGDIRIDSLFYSYKWTTPQITYSFFDGGSYYGSERGVKEITGKMKSSSATS